ncbi:MAG TPA: tyrosine--tRNA ligase, partial [Paludibacteraceae bacterium]|nr:tyrosine--tRNA ligase [Paludibacteraceae bacterium]
LQVFDGVPQFHISKEALSQSVKAVDLLTEIATVFPSKSEMRKTTQAGGVMINKERLENPETLIDDSSLIGGKYLVAQRGKKNYFLLIAE